MDGSMMWWNWVPKWLNNCPKTYIERGLGE